MERSPTATAHRALAFIVFATVAPGSPKGLRYASDALSVTGVAQAFRPAVVFAQSPTYGVGRTPTAAELKAIDIEVTPDGKGLVPGSGTAAAGKEVYARRCETCHGPTGTEGPQDVLAGGQGSLATSAPRKTVGSYWPYATTLWDYINRAMPFDHPSTMTADEVYATTAYVLFLNGIVGERDVIDRKTLPQIRMPNRNGFVADPRPDVGGAARRKP
jgi:S-disulfanyl-L-cysteine oxidoreductase SoxD